MKRLIGVLIALTIVGCASQPIGPGWITLIDGDKGLENWNRIGDANWRAEGGVIMADQGKGGFLVSKGTYQDFAIYAEFWAETDTNSGIFIRASDPSKIGSDSSYEVNIWDIRLDPKYGTGAIVDFVAVPVPLIHRAGGKWNTYEIEAKGADVTVKLNGAVTAKMQNGKYASGPFALQYGPGVQGVTGGPSSGANCRSRRYSALPKAVIREVVRSRLSRMPAMGRSATVDDQPIAFRLDGR